jgi:hypothetical protein
VIFSRRLLDYKKSKIDLRSELDLWTKDRFRAAIFSNSKSLSFISPFLIALFYSLVGGIYDFLGT